MLKKRVDLEKIRDTKVDIKALDKLKLSPWIRIKRELRVEHLSYCVIRKYYFMPSKILSATVVVLSLLCEILSHPTLKD